MNFTAQAALRTSMTGSVLVVSAILAAGCSSSTSGPGSTPAASPSSPSSGTSGTSSAATGSAGTPTTSSSSGAGSSSTPGSASSPSAASGASACGTTDLSASVGGGQGAAGTIYSTIVFTNIGGRSCTLYGYPGVSLADSSATQIGAAARRSATQSAKLVTLSPGAKANFVLGVAEAGNYPSGTCQPKNSSYLKIYPPNQTQSMEISFKTTGCASTSVKLLSVTVVSAGATNPAG
ncbi:MAG: DUF4232 domain-containing protein [Trebonia sp.]